MIYVLLFFCSFDLWCAGALNQKSEDPFSQVPYEKIFSNESYNKIRAGILDPETGCDEIVTRKVQAILKSQKNRSALRPLADAFFGASIRGAAIFAAITYNFHEGSTFEAILLSTLFGLSLSKVPNSLSAYFFPSLDPLKKWEDAFVKNMPLIDKILWPKIASVFEMARRREITKEYYESFFDIALSSGINVAPFSVSAGELEQKFDRLDQFTSGYFKKYDDNEETSNVENFLNTHLRQYIESIYQRKNGIISLYLSGAANSEKNQFIEELSALLQELIGNFSIGNINNCTKYPSFMGDRQVPGEFLRILTDFKRKQHFGLVVINSADNLDTELFDTIEREFKENTPNYEPIFLQKDYQESVRFPLNGILMILTGNLRDDQRSFNIPAIRFPTGNLRDDQRSFNIPAIRFSSFISHTKKQEIALDSLSKNGVLTTFEEVQTLPEFHDLKNQQISGVVFKAKFNTILGKLVKEQRVLTARSYQNTSRAENTTSTGASLAQNTSHPQVIGLVRSNSTPQGIAHTIQEEEKQTHLPHKDVIELDRSQTLTPEVLRTSTKSLTATYGAS